LAILPDSSPTRIRMIGNASWTLVQQSPARATLTSGSARAFDGLNVFDQQYFALDLENETVQRRIATNIAEQIATQLALWFRQRDSVSG
jgi:LPS-assembly lipoprotein